MPASLNASAQRVQDALTALGLPCQVVELPEVRPVVLEVWAYAACCPACGERTVAAVPPGFEPERTFGPRIETRSEG